MMTVIIGGSGSGKSEYAENYTMELSHGRNQYYIATMKIFDKEGQAKAERHRALRKDKGFLTIEQPAAIQNALEKMESEEKTALIECISNLVANEMFSEEVPKTEQQVSVKIIKGIEILKEKLTHLVIVSNNVFEDGSVCDETTMAYIRAMGSINARLTAMADEVVEVVVGISVSIKSKRT